MLKGVHQLFNLRKTLTACSRTWNPTAHPPPVLLLQHTKCRGQWDGLQSLQLWEKSLDLLKSIGCSQSIAWELSCALSAITMACSAWGRPGLATVVGLVSENQAGRGIPLRICIPFLNNMVKQDLPWWIPQILFWEQNVHGTDWLYIQAMTVHHVSSSSCFSLQS